MQTVGSVSNRTFPIPFLLPNHHLPLSLLRSSELHTEALILVSAGATFSNESREKMTGSWMLIRESSIEAVRERLSLDIYTTGGAWDMKNVKITAVAVAMHTSPI